MWTISTLRRAVAIGLTATLLAVLRIPAAAADQVAQPDGSGYPSSPSDDAFYRVPAGLADVPAGTILRSRPVVVRALGLPVPVRTWQVLYRSTDSKGHPDAVSGTVGVLDDGRPDAKRPLVVYSVGSHGLGPLCAPSYLLRLGLEQEEPLMARAIARGWAVMVTDYEGLGTPGPHTYAAGLSTGHAVLDAARAALRLPALGLKRHAPVALWGYSEGGLASTWAAELASSYAPELNLVGTAAGGIPVSLLNVARHIDGTALSGFLLAAAVGLNRAYPEMRLHQILNPAGEKAVADISTMCVAQWTATYPGHRLGEFTKMSDPLALPAVHAVLDANTLGRRTPSAPMHLYESTKDEFMPLEDVRGLVAGYCRHGVAVQYGEDAADEHVSLAVHGASGALDWMSGRFAGRKAPTTC